MKEMAYAVRVPPRSPLRKLMTLPTLPSRMGKGIPFLFLAHRRLRRRSAFGFLLPVLLTPSYDVTIFALNRTLQ